MSATKTKKKTRPTPTVGVFVQPQPQGLPERLLAHAHPLTEVRSYGDELLGWHCVSCGLVEGVPQKRRRKCPVCKFRRVHIAGCQYMKRLRTRIDEAIERAKQQDAAAKELQRKADELTDRAKQQDAAAKELQRKADELTDRARAEKARARAEKTRARASALEERALTYPQQAAA